jgi:hypothetical protein
MEKKQAAATPRTAAMHVPTTPTHDPEQDARATGASSENENEKLYRARWMAIQAAFREARGLTPAHPPGARNPGSG